METFEDKLIKIEYQRLFFYASNSLADSVWDNGNNKVKLEELIESSTSSSYAKFLAAEVLRYFKVEIRPRYYKALSEAKKLITKIEGDE